jgi:hypothetical protein
MMDDKPVMPPMLIHALNHEPPTVETLRASLAVFLTATTNMVQRLDDIAFRLDCIEADLTWRHSAKPAPVTRRWWNLLKWLGRFWYK